MKWSGQLVPRCASCWACAELTKSRTCGRVGEGADEALLGGDGAAQARHEFWRRAACGLRACEDLRRRRLVAGVCAWRAFDELADLVDDGDGVEVALALRVAPGEEAVAAEDDAVAAGCFRDSLAQHHAELEAGALPGEPGELVAELFVEFLHALLAVGGGGESDGPVGVQVIDVREGKEAVQRRVDGGRGGVVAEGDERIELDHRVLFVDAAVLLLEREQLVEIERGEAGALDAAEVAARAFDPEDLLFWPSTGSTVSSLELVLPPPKLVRRRSEPRRLER